MATIAGEIVNGGHHGEHVAPYRLACEFVCEKKNRSDRRRWWLGNSCFVSPGQVCKIKKEDRKKPYQYKKSLFTTGQRERVHSHITT